jgi:hypothetical protein
MKDTELNTGYIWRRQPPDICRIAMNVFNNQSWTADKGWTSRFGFGARG